MFLDYTEMAPCQLCILSFQISSHSELLGLGFAIFLRVQFTACCRNRWNCQEEHAEKPENWEEEKRVSKTCLMHKMNYV